jgi:4'-phosphopantetheinyl transferase
VIHWRFGGWHDAGLPGPEQAAAWLCEEEAERLAAFTVAKRRSDWLIGRLNAKALVRDAVDYRYGVRLPPACVHLARLPSGAPTVRLIGDAARQLPDPLPASVSNSHSHGHALCGLSWTDGFEAAWRVAAIGVDLEKVEPRSDGFVRDFLTAGERDYCAAGGEHRHLRANLVWSAKESVLKVVQRGLTVDTWWLSCLPAPDGESDWLAASITPVDGEWEPLEVTCDPRFPTHGLTFRVLWRDVLGFVVTIAVGWPADASGMGASCGRARQPAGAWQRPGG